MKEDEDAHMAVVESIRVMTLIHKAYFDETQAFEAHT